MNPFQHTAVGNGKSSIRGTSSQDTNSGGITTSGHSSDGSGKNDGSFGVNR